MEQKLRSRRGILAALIVVLLAAALITFPYAFDMTWSLPKSASDRTLTYTEGELTWDSAAKANEDGTIRLSMFSSSYDRVKSADGSNVVAPKTGDDTSVRLVNASKNKLTYTAVLYRDDDGEVPLEASLTGEPAQSFTMPGGVSADSIVDTAQGTLAGGKVKTIDTEWSWRTAVTEQDSELDTALANSSAPKEVKYNLYIVVNDPNAGNDKGGNNGDGSANIIRPKTGDNMDMKLWFALAIISLGVVTYLFVRDRRDDENSRTDAN